MMIPILTIEGAKMAEKLQFEIIIWTIDGLFYTILIYWLNIKAVKYLYTYVYKGHDRIRFIISPDDKSIVVDDNLDNLDTVVESHMHGARFQTSKVGKVSIQCFHL